MPTTTTTTTTTTLPPMTTTTTTTTTAAPTTTTTTTVCPSSLTVELYQFVHPRAQQRGVNYFSAPADYNVPVIAVVSDPVFCIGLVWETYAGDGFVTGEIEDYSPTNACAKFIKPNPTLHAENVGHTVGVRVKCGGATLWTGKFEFYQYQSQCTSGCVPSPSLGNVPASQSPLSNTSTGTVTPPAPSTGAPDPRGQALAAGPVANLTMTGGLSMNWASPDGNSLNPPLYASYDSNTELDGAAGYGFTGSFSPYSWQENPAQPDTALGLFSGNGDIGSYNKATSGTGYYETPHGAYSTLENTGSGWVQRSTVDNRTWTYDSDGVLTGMSRGETSWAVSQTTINGFKVVDSITDDSGAETSLGYGGSEPPRVTSITDAVGRTIGLSYSERHLTGLTLPGSSPYGFKYDDKNQLLRIQLPGGNKYTYTYDSDKRVIGMEKPSGASYQYAYDWPGTIRVTDPLGRRTTLTYDSDRNLTGLTKPGGSWSYGYLDKHLLKIKDPNNNAITYTYDSGDAASKLPAGGG